MKRLRKKYAKRRLAFFHCGEYGDDGDRPHYHALLYGVEFPDRRYFKRGRAGNKIFRSEELDQIWGHGYATVSNLTYESAEYCARYAFKKVTGDMAKAHYTVVLETGEIIERQPEYITMSLRPAIGRRWIERYHGDVYPHDYVARRSGKMKPPRYYDKVRALVAPEEMEKVLAARVGKALKPEVRNNLTPKRLRVREEVKRSQVNLYKRDVK